MLARNAESLYWIGRYVERADDTARILDVSVHQLLEDATVDDGPARPARCSACWACDAVPDGPLDAWSVTELVGYSSHRARARSSSSVSRAPGERPRRPRGGLRRDVGVPQRHLERPARAPAVRPLGRPARVLLATSRTARRCSAGLADSTMSRDDTLAVPTCSAAPSSGST